MNAVRVVVIRGNVRAGKAAMRFAAGSLFHVCDSVSHVIIFRPRIAPERGRYAGRKNSSPGASIQNPGAEGPRQPPRTFSNPGDTTPTWPKPAFQAARRREKLRG